MTSAASTVELLDGTVHPVIGFGTYKVGVIPSLASGQNGVKSDTGKDIGAVVTTALEAGYAMLDCAQFYENEAEIGTALQTFRATHPSAPTPYLCSKIWTKTIYNGRDAIIAEVDRMLTDLQITTLDLLLIHWPVPEKHITAYKTLQELKKAGKVKSIGVSNYTVEDYKELVAAEGVTEKPVCNQIEANPLTYRKRTIEFFQKEGVAVQAYRPLGAGKILGAETVVRIAGVHGVNPSQVLLRWLLQKNIIPLPKSESPERVKNNIDIFHFTLTPEDISQLDTLTTKEAIETYLTTYRSCIIRDTPIPADSELVNRPVTED